jgi:glutamate dehydrogenase (NAD(P)+)
MGRGTRPAAEPFLRVSWVDPDHGWRGFAVIDRLIDGLAGGGIRMRAGVTMSEVEDLARAMSRKKAVAGALGGGAKGGIDLDPVDPLADDALRAYVRAMAPLFRTCWSTAGDLGVPEGRLAEVFADLGLGLTVQALCDHTKDPEAATHAIRTALAVDGDGIPLSDCTAGYGVARAVVAALEHDGQGVDGPTVAIQGFGSIGGTAARYLHAAGLRIVGVADAAGLVVDPAGMDVEALLRCRDRHGVLDRARLPAGCCLGDRADWLALDVDVLVPAATSAAIDVADCDRITARWIVEAANLPTTLAAHHRLTRAGLRIVPDVVANAGTTAWFTWLATAEIEPTPTSTFRRLDALMAETVPAVLRLADERRTATHDAVVELAEQRLAARR